MMSTYETDFYAWTHDQATRLRTHDFARLDIDNLIEEIETMGPSERRQLTNRLEVLLIHLLKWTFQPPLCGQLSHYILARTSDSPHVLLYNQKSHYEFLGPHQKVVPYTKSSLLQKLLVPFSSSPFLLFR